MVLKDDEMRNKFVLNNLDESLRYFAHIIRAENDAAKLMYGFMSSEHK